MSAFANTLRQMIALEGPLPLQRYMQMCVQHYYASRDPFGVQGDFITAPEISQMFGEMIGIWVIRQWQALGCPETVLLVELGPGRGTLMRDVVRTLRIEPVCKAACRIHLVETSPRLRAAQAGLLGPDVVWHDRIEEIPEGPLILIANEFFDALPVQQMVRTSSGWHERCIGYEGERLVWGLSPVSVPMPAVYADWPEGAVAELCPAAQEVALAIATRMARCTGAGLIIDYGYGVPRPGESVQAVRGHRCVDVLDTPGEADLTAHVDFAALAQSFARTGLTVSPVIGQGAYLKSLGMAARFQALSARHPDRHDMFASQFQRLTGTGEGEMGDLFKVLEVSTVR